MIIIVMLGSGGMKLKIALLVICFLEQNVGANAGLLELAVVFYRGSGNIDIYSADISVFVMNGIDGVDALQDVFDRIVFGILTGFNGQTLVSHILQGDHLRPHLLLGQLFTRDVLVFEMIGTIHTAVDTVIGQIQRRKNNDTVAIKALLDLLSDLIDPLNFLRILTSQQNTGLSVGQSGTFPALFGFPGSGLFQDLIDQCHVVLILLSILQCGTDLAVMDKLFCLQ